MILKNRVLSWPDLDKSELDNKVAEGAHFSFHLSENLFPSLGLAPT